jgi:hypothetical protein
VISSTTLCFGFDALSAFEGATSSLSLPFEGFEEMFVTKSGIVVVVMDSSASSSTALSLVYSMRQSTRPMVQHLQSGLVSGFFLNEVGSSSSSSPSSPPKLRSFVSLQGVREGAWARTAGCSLFSTFSSLSFLALFLCLLASALLNTFLLCCDAWNDVVKRVVDDADRLDLWRAVSRFQVLQGCAL